MKLDINHEPTVTGMLRMPEKKKIIFLLCYEMPYSLFDLGGPAMRAYRVRLCAGTAAKEFVEDLIEWSFDVDLYYDLFAQVFSETEWCLA